MLGIIIVLCGLVVMAAVLADKSTRSQRRLRAIGWNLMGLLCLCLGLGVVLAWSHAVQVRTTHAAAAVAAYADIQAESTGEAESDRSDRQSDQPLDETIPLDESVADGGDDEVAGGTAAELTAAEQLAEMDEDDIQVMSRVFIDYDARPDWVDREDVDVGPVHQISVCSGPHMQLRESRKALKGELKKAVDEYVNDLVEHPQAAFWLNLDEEFIRSNLVKPQNLFDEKIISPSFGVMHQSHALVEVGPQFRDHVEASWHQFHAKSRLVITGLICGGVLGVILALFGYFRADTATRGFYTGRLKFVTAIAILAVVVAGLMLARSIPWLWI
jgi:hypothetical protein